MSDNRNQRSNADQYQGRNAGMYNRDNDDHRYGDDNDYDRGQYGTRHRNNETTDSRDENRWDNMSDRTGSSDYARNKMGRDRQNNGQGGYNELEGRRSPGQYSGRNDDQQNTDRQRSNQYGEGYPQRDFRGSGSTQDSGRAYTGGFSQSSFGNQNSNYGGSYLENEGYGNRRSDNYGGQSWSGSYSSNNNTGMNGGNYDNQWNYGNDSRQGSSASMGLGQHKGKGPKGYKRSDDRIKDDINDRLSDDAHLDANDIEVNVSNGEVLLTGTVDDRMAKRRAEDMVEAISGVQNVENRLRVKQGQSDTDRNNVNSTTNKTTGTTSLDHNQAGSGNSSKKTATLHN